MKKLVLLLVTIMVCSFIDIKAQTPQQDLSPGSFKIMNKPFQIEAWSFPNYLVDGAWTNKFNADHYILSKFTSFLNSKSYPGLSYTSLLNFPPEVRKMTWSKLIIDDLPIDVTEIAHIDNLYRLQYEDDNLVPSNVDLVNKADAWFSSKRIDVMFNNTILSVDLPFLGWFPEQVNQLKYMVKRLQPDLIMFNYYPWLFSFIDYSNINQRPYLHNWYGRHILYRNLAISARDDGKVIPFGAFTQTYTSIAYPGNPVQTIIPTVSQMRLNYFGSLAFGAKILSAFVYNDYPSSPPLFQGILNNQTNPLFIQQTIINEQITKLGTALLQLQTSDVRFIPRKTSDIGWSLPQLKWNNPDINRPDPFLTDVTASRGENIQNGDVLIGYFKPVHKSLDGTNTTNENYFMIVNGFYENESQSTIQNIHLRFDFGNISAINSLLRLNRLTGNIEVLPLIKENTTGNNYCFDLELNGGEGDLFKYNDGVPFVGFTNLSTSNEIFFVDKEIFLYPNPATNQINLKTGSKERGSFYKIFDYSGKNVISGKIKSENTVIELDHLSNGNYILKIGENKNQTFKVVKK